MSRDPRKDSARKKRLRRRQEVRRRKIAAFDRDCDTAVRVLLDFLQDGRRMVELAMLQSEARTAVKH